MHGNFSQTITKQIISAVDVRDDKSQTHWAAAVPARIAPGVRILTNIGGTNL
jgi:hypothetical protein